MLWGYNEEQIYVKTLPKASLKETLSLSSALARQKAQLTRLESHNRAKEAALEADRQRYDQLDRALAEAQIEKEEAVRAIVVAPFFATRLCVTSGSTLFGSSAVW